MKRKTKFWLILGLALFAIIFIPFIFSVKQAMNHIEKLASLHLPNPDSSYNLKTSKMVLRNVRTFQTDTISLSGITIINFWASWCKPCIEEQPSLEELAKNRNVIQFSFDSIGSLKKVINKLNWTIPAYALTDTAYFNEPQILPTTIVLKDSTVLKVIYGQRNWTDTSITNYFETLN